MSTYTQILYQIVFSPKAHMKVISEENREELFKYLWGIMKNLDCKLYRINGTEDHLHIIVDLHPSVALADLIKKLKVASSKMIKQKQLFDGFPGWQEGYGAFTYSIKDKGRLVDYVINQKQHHKKQGFIDEYKQLLKEHGVSYDERYL